MSTRGVRDGIIFPDLHSPYHDRKAWGLVLKVGEWLAPDFLVCLGDFQDNYMVSDHRKDPRRRETMEGELKVSRSCRAQLDRLGAKEKLFTEGNHEKRWERYLLDRAPHSVQIAPSMVSLLELPERGWKCFDYGDFAKVGKMHFTHCVGGQAGRYAHEAAIEAFGGNVVIGHTHRLAQTFKGNLKQETHVGITLGWLGDASRCDYMHKAKAAKDWHLGFGVAKHRPDGVVHVHPIPIINYSCEVDGRVFHA
jgi:hypothetical protein